MILDYDVLVIGGGGAGCRAALEACETGAKVAVTVKGRFALNGVRGSGATGYRTGARPLHLFSSPKSIRKSNDGNVVYEKVSFKPDEEQDIYFKRSLQAGLGMADRHLVKIMVNEIPKVKHTLERWGLVLDKSQFIESLIFPMPGLGYAVKSLQKVDVLENTMITGLFIQDGVCSGALALNELSGETIIVRAKSTILATGGCGQLYMLNFHPSCVTGDGYAIAYEAGAKLINMEFSQVFISINYPTIDSVPFQTWNLHPKILDNNFKSFMHLYLPKGISVDDCMDQKACHGPFSARDSSKYLHIAMDKETKNGCVNEHMGFQLDTDCFSIVGARKVSFAYRGIDLKRKYVSINNAYHCSNGGLKINENGQTSILGLYAIGETAAGPYGADRLGGAMMACSQVYGTRAGRHAAARAKEIDSPKVRNEIIDNQLARIKLLSKCHGDRKPYEFIKVLKDSAWSNLMVVRSDKSLSQFLAEINSLRDDMNQHLLVSGTDDLIAALELHNMLQVSEIIARAALMRTESRGSHYREDYPERDDSNWLQSIIVRKKHNQTSLEKISLDHEWQNNPTGFDGLWWA